jgi:cell division protein FtsB
MTPLTYVKLGIAVFCLLFSAYIGYSFEHSRFMSYKAEQIQQTQKKEREAQLATDEIRKTKDAQIKTINNQLLDAIGELRKRSSRTTEANNGQSGTGATLYAEDAEFLIREAARADQIRIGLEACYKQYDAIQ